MSEEGLASKGWLAKDGVTQDPVWEFWGEGGKHRSPQTATTIVALKSSPRAEGVKVTDVEIKCMVPGERGRGRNKLGD